MGTLRMGFLLLLACSLTLAGCDKKKPTEAEKPLPVEKSTSEKYNEKLKEVTNLRQTLIGKQTTVIERENFFRSKITEVKQEVLEQKGGDFGTYEQVVKNRQLNTRLGNLRDYHAYLKQLSEFRAKIAISIDDLLGVERKFEADYQMLSLTEEINIDDLIKQVDTVIQKHLPYANDLVLNIKTDESLEDIWNEIKAEKERVESENRKKEEEIRLEKERIEKAKQDEIKAEKERVESENRKKEEEIRLEKERIEKAKRDTIKTEKEMAEAEKKRKEEEERIEKAKQDEIKAAEDRCQKTPTCLHNRQIEEEIRNGFYTRINQLSDLTPDFASYLINGFKQNILDLSNLQTLTPESAHAIFQWKGERCGWYTNRSKFFSGEEYVSIKKEIILKLNRLDFLSSEVASEIAQYFTENIDKELAKCNIRMENHTYILLFHLELNGLKTISREAMKILAGWRGSSLSLLGITELPPETAVFLSKKGRRYDDLELSESLKAQLKTYRIHF